MTAGFIEGKFVSFHGFKKNDLGYDNIEYVGDGIMGVCTPSYWASRIKKEKDKPTR